jgi:hypothetical protein
LFYTLKRSGITSPTVPPRYAFRLEDLRAFHLVRASCHACGHKAIVPNAALLQGRPGYTRLMALRASAAVPEMRREGQGLARGGVSAARLN